MADRTQGPGGCQAACVRFRGLLVTTSGAFDGAPRPHLPEPQDGGAAISLKRLGKRHQAAQKRLGVIPSRPGKPRAFDDLAQEEEFVLAKAPARCIGLGFMSDLGKLRAPFARPGPAQPRKPCAKPPAQRFKSGGVERRPGRVRPASQSPGVLRRGHGQVRPPARQDPGPGDPGLPRATEDLARPENPDRASCFRPPVIELP